MHGVAPTANGSKRRAGHANHTASTGGSTNKVEAAQNTLRFAQLEWQRETHQFRSDKKKKTWIYTLNAVAAVDVPGVALVTRLEVRSRNKQSEGQKCEDTSEHLEK